MSAASAQAGPGADLSRRFNYIFFNQAPTADPTTSPSNPITGFITGRVNAMSNNGFAETYTLTTNVKFGTLDFDFLTGEFEYTPNEELVDPGIVDQFTVRIDNGTAAALPGFLGAVQDWLHTMAIDLGLAQKDFIEKTITLTVDGTGEQPGVYGTIENQKYWVKQSYENCTLMATAMAVAQLNGTVGVPNEAYMVALATATNSVASPGQKMYLAANIADGVAVQDAVVLLNNHFNLDASTTTYPGTKDDDGEPVPGTLQDGQAALRDLQAALAYGKAAMVTVNSAGLWSAAVKGEPSGTPNYFDADHEVVVIKVDLENGRVFFNDSGPLFGQGMEVPLGAFLSAWQPNNYELTIVSKKTPSTEV
ncbi:MAG: hypothetical protein E6Q56_05680 [Mycobacterium sp.]|nr:MAG: hypothetical protein E6Q56_05680 [Mycobacterium sp.]